MRALIAEDETRIRSEIVEAMQQAGFTCDAVGDGEEAWFQGETGSYDIVVLDLGLPRLDGLVVLKRWRQAGHDVPVLILTARGAWPERVEGINAGADDYLTKPFQLDELIARVRAITRRAAGRANAVITVGAISVDTRQMQAMLEGRPIQLTALEYRLLSYLMHHHDRVVPAGELIGHVYGDDDAREANALEALIVRVRRKLGSGSIETRRGFGYTMAGVTER
ncbi:MAG: response regulator [Hyphomicrobiaceae bacterium]|mgnify:CR=1 FL=1|nr:response regulator [Hyphomicrobiaceae bacterium]MCC0009947.1 response regulator [Hyphomicrobiaceae bacterium]